jgi:hypothetical protein
MWIAAPVSYRTQRRSTPVSIAPFSESHRLKAARELPSGIRLRMHLEVFARYGEGTDGAKIRQVAHADRQCHSAIS